MANEDEFPRNDAERAWVGALPMTSAPPPGAEDRLVSMMRGGGYFGRRRPGFAFWRVAAAVLLFVSGALVGARAERLDSLETRLTREDLSVHERVLLLQRAGSAYVLAMQRLAAAAPRDKQAREIASQSLTGAALAAARVNLDAGLSPDLISFLDPRRATDVAPQPILIWY